MHIYIYIYIYRERERGRCIDRDIGGGSFPNKVYLRTLVQTFWSKGRILKLLVSCTQIITFWNVEGMDWEVLSSCFPNIF